MKIRGVRVEPGEVEAALLAHPAVREAVVAGRGAASPEGARLVAWVVGAPQARPDPIELRRFLRARLPDVMVPRAIVVLDRLPLLPGGKVDRLALPEPTTPSIGRTGPGPRDPTEARIAEIWQGVLGARPAIDQGFFELGGTSLAALEVLARLRDALGVDVPLADLLARPTIGGRAAEVARPPGAAPLVGRMHADRGRAGRAPLVWFHGDFNGGGLYCRDLFATLDRPIIVARPHEPGGPTTIEGMAAAYLPLVRTEIPRGPFLLGGHCNGGVVAFELARQLVAAGERVGARTPPTVREQRFRYLGDALAAYHAGPYPGGVTLLVPAATASASGGDPPADPTAGFGDIAATVDVRVVPGDHLTMLTRHRATLARAIEAALEASDAPRPRSGA